jgi:hypothetical protein
MRIHKSPLVRTSILVALLAGAAFADHIKIDYDHHINFENYHTYSWGKVETTNSLWDSRVKNAIDRELAAKGWTQVASGGSVTLAAVKTTHLKPEVNTLYDGFGGRRWGGFSDATTTVQNYKVGTLVVEMFNTSSGSLIWRGSSSSALSGNPNKNAKELNKEVQKMFGHFPPKTVA